MSSDATKSSVTAAAVEVDGGAPAAAPRTALDFNLPKGDKFILNSRGQRLHLRTFIPDSGEAKALLFWYHGYAAHINGPTLLAVMAGLVEGGFAVIAVDQHGHGYSDGERVLITDYQHLVDDNLAVLDAIAQGAEDGEHCCFGLDAKLRQTLQALPFFLGGQSMGGGLALMVAMRLRSDGARADVAARFVGVMTNCPAIVGNPPPKPVLMLLKYVIAPLFPKVQLPTFLERVSLPELVWTSSEHAEMGALDKMGKPGGLGWPGTMRIGTGSQLIDMLAALQSKLSEVDFPFIVLHDPEDRVVLFVGTKMLLEKAATPIDVVRGKEVKEMPGMKHDLVSNATQDMLAAYLDWAAAQLEARSESP